MKGIPGPPRNGPCPTCKRSEFDSVFHFQQDYVGFQSPQGCMKAMCLFGQIICNSCFPYEVHHKIRKRNDLIEFVLNPVSEECNK